MNIAEIITEGLLTLVIAPLQLIIAPIDLLLQNIDGIEIIPESIEAVFSLIGDIPETLVYLGGINPIIWNIMFLVLVLYIGLAPTINIIKKVWAWVRP